MYKLESSESEQSKNVNVFSFTTGLSSNLAEKQPICSNHDENNYRWQLMLNGQFIKMSVNGVSMICGLESTVIEQ